jgi:hypothetical protein
MDLELNLIRDIDEKCSISETKSDILNHVNYKERKRYIFTHKDFKKIVETCLMNSYEFDIEPRPIMIKNPYTNKEFTKTELRFFNSKLKDMPIIWHMFTDSDFDIVTLKYKYYSYLLELCIPSYIEKIDESDIVEYIIDICINHNIQYCYGCISEKHNIKTRIVKNALISWIRNLKLGKHFSDSHIDNIRNTYEKYNCFHNYKDGACPPGDNKENGNDLCIDLSKSLFCVGYYNKNEEKRNYRNKIRVKNMKERFYKTCWLNDDVIRTKKRKVEKY